MRLRSLTGGACLVVGCVAAIRPSAQAPPIQSLTTVSVKRNVSGSPNSNMEVRPGGRLMVTNTTLRNMLRNIDRLQEYQLVGGPDWVTSDRWDILAVVDVEVTEPQAAQLLKQFLVERFKLQIHSEQREVPVYSLVLARPDGMLGPELRRSSVECAKTKTCGNSAATGVLRVVGMELGNQFVIRAFERASGRMVVDRTGFVGSLDFTLRWRPDDAQDVNAEYPSLFTAIEEQLGLRLRPDRAAANVTVIDSAARPVED